MSKRVLAIGVGGSGKAALTILKERLIETYNEVPDNVVLLSLDTDDVRDVDAFAGVQLDTKFDDRGREPEFRHVVSKPGVTMDTVISDITTGRTSAFMSWLEHDKLDRILGPAARDIRGGAQQRRPVGRVALFQRWDDPISSSILQALTRVYGEPEEEKPVDDVKVEQSKRLVFIIGSVAGGTGSGFFVDVANLVQHAVKSNTRFQSVDVSAIIVLPDAFSAYTTVMSDPTNLKPNSYAALRELDRFIRTHRASLPYMIRYGPDVRNITWSTNKPLDHAYLVDTASPSTIGDFDLTGNPMRGVFPVIADFIMTHVDDSLGNNLATLRANAEQHYNEEEGWEYSGFNVMTYLFPVADVIQSFGYRFLREMVSRQFLPIADKKDNALEEQNTIKEAERIFSGNRINDRVMNPSIIQKSIAVTRKLDPEMVDASWPGLFNLISLAEGSFAEDYAALEQWMAYLTGNLTPSREGDYKRETYDEGYTRLTNFAEEFMKDCLGPQIDVDDEESREGGEWDKILGRYREALRQRFSEALDMALLDVLNRRDPREPKMLQAHRLPSARFMVAALKDKLLHFKEVLEKAYREFDIDTNIRQTSTQLRDAIAWMQDTKDTKTRSLLGPPEARKAQDAYISFFQTKMGLVLHQRVYRVVMDVLDTLGAAEEDRDSQASVLEQAALELENWQATWQEVDKIFYRANLEHEKHRQEKRDVRVRRYLTNDAFEDELFKRPEHVGAVSVRVLGQVRGETGMTWERVDNTEPLHYKLSTMWTGQADGAEKIAASFTAGARQLFQVVRQSVTIADRVADEFKSPASFVNTAGQISQPFLRYNPALNQKEMFAERYVSFNLSRATDKARRFLEEARGVLGNQGVNIDATAESQVACTVLDVARGARLGAVDQFTACEPAYRVKLYQGRESLHLFPEEQEATDYEQRIEELGEYDNKQRPLSPELVIAMGDDAKLQAFVLACAYGLVEVASYRDENGMESTEVWLNLEKVASGRRFPLSLSSQVRELDPRYVDMQPEEQVARLYLNALQNFVLEATQKPGVPNAMVQTLVDTLRTRGVSLEHIQNPFTLAVRDVSNGIQRVIDGLEPVAGRVPDEQERKRVQALRRINRYLKPFQDGKVADFKRSPAPRVRDMGTVMHLILRAEIGRLKVLSAGAVDNGD